MTSRQFVAPTAREALQQVREALGPDAVILQNRRVPEGVMVTAIAESDLEALQEPAEQSPQTPRREPARAARNLAQIERTATPPRSVPRPEQRPATDEASSPMSTVNFQRYANERRERLDVAASAAGIRVEARSAAMPDDLAPTVRQVRGEASGRVGSAAVDGMPAIPAPAEMQRMMQELRAMRSFISQQFSALAWVDGVRRTPAQARQLRRMLNAGFSGALARSLVGRLPAELDEAAADTWLDTMLSRNLRCACWDDGVIARGGVFALVGPTGVGKTTSAAKIAARFAREHGADVVGLISVDAYRVAGQDQLRRYGRLIGAAVHTAHDAQGLHDLLHLLRDKRLVLVDTAGLGQRDPRVAELMDGIAQGPVRPLVVVSAGAQAETIAETLDAYRAFESAGVLMTKSDEACRLGGALDVLIRHRLPIAGIGNGQRVPEDWEEPDAMRLVKQAMQVEESDADSLPDIDLTMLMQRLEPLAPLGPNLDREALHV